MEGVMMKEWIPFEEGRYLAEDAFMVTPQGKAVRIATTIIKYKQVNMV